MRFAIIAIALFFVGAAQAAPKSYAVFLATYDVTTGQATGGVAGSAFFVSPSKAITAFHVLQPKSFANARTQIWLVHEGEPAIEILSRELTADPANDRTVINLKNANVPSRFIFEKGVVQAGDKVETDGFHANSVGPLLVTIGSRLQIKSVPHLERLHAEGRVLRSINVELNATDVQLKNKPCVQVSYLPVVGLSGGPVISKNRVVGMNSFADPESRTSTWAVSLTN